MTSGTAPRYSVRRLMLWIALALALYVFFQLVPILLADGVFQVDDFVEYWSAGRLVLNGQDPYSTEAMEALQTSMGRTRTVMMWNPPMVLVLAIPLGALPYAQARMVWYLLQVSLAVVAASWLWEVYGGDRRKRWIAWLIACGFSATFSALSTGQISLVMLLGLAGFLRYERHGKPWQAGAFVALVAVKPHLLYLLWLALAVWCWRRRRWTELLAAAGVMIAGTALAMLFDVTVVRQYARSMVADGPIWWYTPTLGGALRAWLGPEHIWLQFAPMLLGSGWLALRLQQVRAWRWAAEAPLLVLISVITAAYGWTFDQAVILVAIFEAAERLAGMLRQRSAIVLMITAVGLNGAVLWLHGLMVEGWFWWLAPAWLGWYLLSRHWAPGCTSDGAGQDNVETGRA